MTKISLHTILRYVVIGILLPFVVQYVFYFRYTSNYMPNTFSEKGFNYFYNRSVFRYRVLGRSLHLWVYHQLQKSEKIKTVKESPVYNKRLKALDQNADDTFYLTYFVMAAFFNILSSLALLYLFDSVPLFRMSRPKKIFITSATVLLIGFMQFTIAPYDNISYFLFIAASILFFRYLLKPQWFNLLPLCLCVIAYTLNHESALVSLSLMAGVCLTLYGFTMRVVRLIALPCLCYVLTWVGLRVFIPNDPSDIATAGLKLWLNFDIKGLSSLIGILFACISFYFLLNIADNPTNKKLIRNFLLAASPYIIMIPLVGIMIELRLWMPVLLGSIVLSQLNLSAFKLPDVKDNNYDRKATDTGNSQKTLSRIEAIPIEAEPVSHV